MSETIAPIVKKMKILTLFTAISLLITAGGIAACTFYFLKDNIFDVPMPISAFMYSLLVLTMLYAAFKMIMITNSIGDKLKQSLRELNIIYIIISILSTYLAFTFGLNFIKYIIINQIVADIFDDTTGIKIIFMISFYFLMYLPLMYVFVSINIVHIIIIIVNFVIGIILSINFEKYYIRNSHKKLTEYYSIISYIRIIASLTLMWIFSIMWFNNKILTIDIFVLFTGISVYNFFVLLLIRNYKKLSELKTKK